MSISRQCLCRALLLVAFFSEGILSFSLPKHVVVGNKIVRSHRILQPKHRHRLQPKCNLGAKSAVCFAGAAKFLLSPEMIFKFQNLYIIPFWMLMIAAPNHKITKQVMSSYATFVPLAVLYIWLLVAGLASPGGLDILSGPPTLAALSKVFAGPYAMACAWAHLITLDLFVGRWILFDSIRNRVFAVHSLILANLLGPIGLLSHLLTREVVRAGRPRDPVSDGLCDEMSDDNLLRLVDD